MYQNNRSKYEDAKSTGISFTLVGGVGIILLILVDTGILPIPLQDYMKIIMSVVMGALFLIFFIIGIQAILSLKQIRQEAGQQESLETEITEWFLSNHKEELLSYRTDDMDDAEPDSLYYPRYDRIDSLIAAQYPALSDEDREHLAEELYAAIFPE